MSQCLCQRFPYPHTRERLCWHVVAGLDEPMCHFAKELVEADAAHGPTLRSATKGTSTLLWIPASSGARHDSMNAVKLRNLTYHAALMRSRQ